MESLSISEMAQSTGLSVHTLRYYERIGLITAIPRAASGHRRYRETDVGWVDFLHKLRSTGMPIRDMCTYAEMLRQGPETADARQALLEAHGERVRARIAELAACLVNIDYKIERYQRGEFK